jgi:hypothetical protein
MRSGFIVGASEDLTTMTLAARADRKIRAHQSPLDFRFSRLLVAIRESKSVQASCGGAPPVWAVSRRNQHKGGLCAKGEDANGRGPARDGCRHLTGGLWWRWRGGIADQHHAPERLSSDHERDTSTSLVHCSLDRCSADDHRAPDDRAAHDRAGEHRALNNRSPHNRAADHRAADHGSFDLACLLDDSAHFVSALGYRRHDDESDPMGMDHWDHPRGFPGGGSYPLAHQSVTSPG